MYRSFAIQFLTLKCSNITLQQMAVLACKPAAELLGQKALTLRRLMSYIYMEHPFLMFLDHTRRSTVGRTPLDEWSARRRDLYL